MKKGWKIFWIICLIIAMLGLGALVTGVAMGFQLTDVAKAYGLTDWPSDHRELVSDVKDISIDMGAGELVLQTYNGEDVRCDVDEPQYMTCAIEQDGDELDIDISHSKQFGTDAGKVTLYVPANQEFEEFSLHVGAGNVVLGEIQARKVSIECGAGRVAYAAPGVETDYNFDMECAVGNIKVGTTEYSGLATKKKINNNAQKNIEMECGAGEIVVTFEEQ